MTVHLVGGGPGDAELLTVRAARLISTADVVVHDRLIDRSVLELVHEGAELIDVGKEPGHERPQATINELLISLSRHHGTVVRLKGGDPFVFGRGGEEFEALRSAGVAVEVVPGVTSAFAGPLAAGIPVTHRGLSRGVTVVAGQGENYDEGFFRRLANPQLTLVVLMGVSVRSTIVKELIDAGLSSSTPVAVIQSAWTETERVTRGVLSELGAMNVASPAVIVIGACASLTLRDVLCSPSELIDLCSPSH